MIYKLNMADGIVEFTRNRGRAFLEATDASEAVRATRELFSHMREARVQSVGPRQYLVSFRVSFDYRLSLLRSIEKSARLLRSRKQYLEGRHLDRYIVATIYLETGKPDYLDEFDIKREISSLRKSAVVARELPNVMDFVDYDICIYNYLELNNKEGFHSRVVRRVLE